MTQEYGYADTYVKTNQLIKKPNKHQHRSFFSFILLKNKCWETIKSAFQKATATWHQFELQQSTHDCIDTTAILSTLKDTTKIQKIAPTTLVTIEDYIIFFSWAVECKEAGSYHVLIVSPYKICYRSPSSEWKFSVRQEDENILCWQSLAWPVLGIVPWHLSRTKNIIWRILNSS